MPEPPPTVLVFLKAPRVGEVKTRLAAEMGEREAARAYRAMAERQLAVIPREWRVEIHYAPRGAGREMRAWLGVGRCYRVQVGDDLGARLRHAFARAFASGARTVIAIGADCPELDAADLQDAAAALRRCDVVIGPARDGGYTLIGLRAPAPALFRGIPWSTGGVLTATLRRARAAKLRVRRLRELEDVDDAASWRRHRERIAWRG